MIEINLLPWGRYLTDKQVFRQQHPFWAFVIYDLPPVVLVALFLLSTLFFFCYGFYALVRDVVWWLA